MVTSQNGYPANDRSQVTSYVVTASGRKMTLRKGSAGEMLAHCIRWFDENIRDLDPGELDEWGYAERPIRGGTELSNHASGTAGDVNATKWPLGVEPTSYLTKAEIARLKQHLTVYQGCIRWGGDYMGRKDPMHFEIDRDQATVDRVWDQINQGDDMPDLNEISVVVRDWSPSAVTAPTIDWGNGKKISVAQQTAENAKGIAILSGQIAAVLAAVQGLTAGGVDLAAVEAAAKAGTDEALAGFEATVTIGNPAQ